MAGITACSANGISPCQKLWLFCTLIDQHSTHLRQTAPPSKGIGKNKPSTAPPDDLSLLWWKDASGPNSDSHCRGIQGKNERPSLGADLNAGGIY